MIYTFTLRGRLSVELPSSASTTSDQIIYKADVLEQQLLANRLDTVITLAADGPIAVAFESLVSASMVLLRVVTPNAGKVLAALTHLDGTTQVVPLDPLFLLLSGASPITAITLARTPTVLTSVEVLLGELAP